MPVVILYLLKLSASLSLVWLFYHFLLRKLTFYGMNRWYLLGYSLLSFLIPFINIGLFMDNDPVTRPAVIQYIPVIWDFKTAKTVEHTTISGWNLSFLLAVLGSSWLALRFTIRWLALRKLRTQARLISEDGMRIYQVDKPITPFSFGQSIYINGEQHTREELDAIIRHEWVHVRQKHTIDILLAELFCMINWYNPFVWLIRNAIRQNLEFIADNTVIRHGCDKKSYQYHLLKVAGQSRYCLANNFNFSSLKKRILMMNKVKTARVHLVKFLFIVPFLAVLLLAFRSQADKRPVQPSTQKAAAATMQIGTVQSVTVGPEGAKSLVRIPRAGLVGTTSAIDTVPNKKDATGKNPIPARWLVKSTRPLFVVDGVTMPEDWAPATIDPNKIESIDIWKNNAETAAKFGKDAPNGVVEIFTKKDDGGRSVTPGSPTIHVNEADFVAPPVSGPIVFRPAPVAPVIVATPPVPGAPVPAAPAPAITFRPLAAVADQPAAHGLPDGVLYFVNGVETPAAEVNRIDPKNLESIDVQKNDEAVKKYGDKARNGILFITTKKGSPAHYNQIQSFEMKKHSLVEKYGENARNGHHHQPLQRITTLNDFGPNTQDGMITAEPD